MYARTTQMLSINILTGDGLHHLRTCQKHIAGSFGHHDEVGQCRRINGTTGARTHDRTDLRDDTGSQYVAFEDLTISGQGGNALLNTCAARVVHADDRSAIGHGHIHHLANLLSHCLGQRATIDCEVLSIDINQTTINRCRTCDDTIAEELLLFHAEVVATMEFEHIILFKAAIVYQHVDALTGCVFATCMLLVNCLLATAQASLLALLDELLNFLCLFAHSYLYWILCK